MFVGVKLLKDNITRVLDKVPLAPQARYVGPAWDTRFSGVGLEI